MPSDVESPMYATELHEVVFRDAVRDAVRDAAPSDFDACAPFLADFDSRGAGFRSEPSRPLAFESGVLSGDSTMLCEDTPEPAGTFWAAAVILLLSGVLGPITPARPAASRARTPTTTSATTLPTNLRRRCSRDDAARRHASDLSCSQSWPMAPRRIGSSTNRQERAATVMVAATWSTWSERV